MKMRRAITGASALGLIVTMLAACSSGAHGEPAAQAITAKAPFSGHGSTEAAYVLGATPGEELLLVDGTSSIVGRGLADRLGSLVVPDVAPGSGYTFRSVQGGGRVLGTGAFRVYSTSYVPPTSLYASQHLRPGMNYIRVRDGVYINATVRLPEGKTLADGPFPTVMEYSGYQTAAPGNLLDAIVNGKGTSNPLLPDTSTAVGSLLAPLLGFASVSVQMRGTGCSGGAFDLFGPDMTEDGYDVVETIAHQDWAKGHKIGLVGISFSGISQMFVGGSRPPGLAAIAPLSATNDLYAVGFPGGMLNDGFAADWLKGRFASAQPAPSDGALPYANYLVSHGDTQCIANQALHLQAYTYAKDLGEASYRVPSLYDVRTPELWASKIDVPVYIAGAFQDEQTGGQWPAMITYLKNDPHLFATIINGTHVDSLNPAIIGRWLEFLQIFVANEVPNAPSFLANFGTALYGSIAGAPSQPITPLRFTAASSPAQARALFEKDTPRVRVLFDNGGSPAYTAGAMGPEFEEDFTAWPPPQAKVTRWWLGAGGAMSTTSPHALGSVSFRPDPSLRPPDDLPHGSAWAALPPYDWAPVTGQGGVGFITAPLSHDVVVVGPAAVDVWVKSSAADTDLQATISEVRADGQEMFVNTGDLRASLRALGPTSTALNPVPTFLKSDAAPLPKGRYVEVQIPLTPFAYAFRAGSRIRITLEAPGGDRPSWEYNTTQTHGTVVDTVSLGGALASSLVIPVLSNVQVPDPQPACPSLRGQPCRSYVAAGNGG